MSISGNIQGLRDFGNAFYYEVEAFSPNDDFKICTDIVTGTERVPSCAVCVHVFDSLLVLYCAVLCRVVLILMLCRCC
jgi:hypothetical protein